MQKRKTAKNLGKTPPIIAAPAPRDPESEIQTQLELYWCIQQMETSCIEGKLSKKAQDDLLKNIKTLKSSTAPLVKKRQIMKAVFGDYRSKMKEEEKKLALAAKQIKFTSNGEAPTKSSFVKKAAIVTSGKDFKFNFNPDTSVDTPPVGNDVENANVPAGSTAVIANNINFSFGNTFKFNFSVEESNEDIAFDKLSIKS